MNVLELLRKKDPNVTLWQWDASTSAWRPHPNSQSLTAKIRRLTVPRTRLTRPFETIRGLRLPPGTRMAIATASSFWTDTAKGAGSFLCQAQKPGAGHLSVQWRLANENIVMRQVDVGSRLTRFAIPPCPAKDADLLIEAPAENTQPVFVGVHVLLDREELYRRCIGRGVEIGPGPKPQILPGWRRKVSYVEQATPDQWRLLYGIDSPTPVDQSLWNHYIVGNADNIPVSPETLDFIFSSHVVEHLANPLGHLAYWATLLKPGGIVAAVIPDREGCKDYVFSSSTTEELLAEWVTGDMEPSLAHYERWAAHRAPGSDPRDIMASKRSIHVHFYTPSSMAAILGRMCRQIGYHRFSITSEPNHKDFFVVLEK